MIVQDSATADGAYHCPVGSIWLFLLLQSEYVGSLPQLVVFQIVLLKDAKCARLKLFCQDTQLSTEISLHLGAAQLAHTHMNTQIKQNMRSLQNLAHWTDVASREGVLVLYPFKTFSGEKKLPCTC